MNTEEREGPIVNPRVMGTQKVQRRLDRKVNLGMKNVFFRVGLRLNYYFRRIREGSFVRKFHEYYIVEKKFKVE